MVKIKNIRLGLGLTAADLSQKLGISRGYLTLVENGQRRLPKQLVGKLARALHLTKSTAYDWYLEQELTAAGITDKKSHQLITTVLKVKPLLLSAPENCQPAVRAVKQVRNGRRYQLYFFLLCKVFLNYNLRFNKYRQKPIDKRLLF